MVSMALATTVRLAWVVPSCQLLKRFWIATVGPDCTDVTDTECAVPLVHKKRPGVRYEPLSTTTTSPRGSESIVVATCVVNVAVSRIFAESTSKLAVSDAVPLPCKLAPLHVYSLLPGPG